MHLFAILPFFQNMIVLPRQARDKHRRKEHSKRDDHAFVLGCKKRLWGCKTVVFGVIRQALAVDPAAIRHVQQKKTRFEFEHTVCGMTFDLADRFAAWW